jgi:hypothetical protein
MSENKKDRQQSHDPQAAGTEVTNAQEAPQGEDRRKVLQKILIGGGIAAGSAMLPDKWTRPVVDEIVAPAHAQRSTTSAPTTTKKENTGSRRRGITRSFILSVISNAHFDKERKQSKQMWPKFS